MKKVLLLLALLVGVVAFNSNASTVLWLHSIAEDAVVHDGGTTYALDEYVENVLGATMDDVVYRIHVVTDNTYMDFRIDEYYDDEIGETVPASFDYAEEGNMAGPTGDGNKYIKLQQARVGETGEIDWDNEAVVELGLMDENWVFSQLFAVTDTFKLDDINANTYESGTLAPPVPDTQLIDFHTFLVPVPECNSVGLIAVGLAALLSMRKRHCD